MNIVMMGVQGSGKGTQSKMLSERLNLPHVSTGDLFRANIGANTELGQKAKKYADAGELVPDAIVIDMVKDRIAQDDASDGVLLDGFPRSAVQLAACELICPIDHAVLLELDDATAIERLTRRSECPKCGILYGANRKPSETGKCDECGGELKERSDDRDVDAVKTRLDAYHREIGTMIEYYEWKGVLRRVDADQSVQQVLEDVLSGIGRK
jgi:adenylate kinase